MSRGPALEVEGLRTLRASLKSAGLELADLKRAHADVAQLVVRAAAPHAPHRTGALAASTRPSGTQSAAVVRAGRASIPYAGPIHWGWPRRGIPAQPWLYDAAVNSQQQWTGLYLRKLQKIIDQIEGAPGP
jgi:hypothetical protein